MRIRIIKFLGYDEMLKNLWEINHKDLELDAKAAEAEAATGPAAVSEGVKKT